MQNGKSTDLIVRNKPTAKAIAKAIEAAAKMGAKKTKEAKASSKSNKNKRNVHTGQGVPAAQIDRAIAARVGAGDDQARELAKALCCPNMFPSFRVQDGYASMPTGCSSPFHCEPAAWSATDDTAADVLGIPHNEAWAIATRDPRCTLRYYDAVGGDYAYRAVQSDGLEEVTVLANHTLIVDRWRADRTFQPHGPFLYTGYGPDGAGVDQRLTLGHDIQSLNLTGLPASTSTIARIWALIGDELLPFRRTQTTTAGGALTMLFSDFVSDSDAGVSLPDTFHWGGLTLNQAITGGSLDILDDGPLLRQLALGDWEDVEDIFEKLRFNALNLMYSNTCPELAKEGFAAGWQVPGNMDFISIMYKGFEALANRPQAERMLANKGIHGFWKSSAPKDWDYLDVGGAEEDTGISSYPLYGSDYLMICVNVPHAAGRAGYWTIFSDTEQRHESVWFGEGYPAHERRTFERALEIQSRVPQWHENPFHIKDIFKWIGRNKERLKKTADLINSSSGYRAAPITEPLSALLDTWF